jgi:hypothetical protein
MAPLFPLTVRGFARDMAFRAELDDADPLTPRQAEYLRNAVIRFRRQIDPKIVDLADLKNRKTARNTPYSTP